jgi:hypothetical protein
LKALGRNTYRPEVTLRMEVIYSSKILVTIYSTTWHHNPEDNSLHSFVLYSSLQQVSTGGSMGFFLLIMQHMKEGYADFVCDIYADKI